VSRRLRRTIAAILAAAVLLAPLPLGAADAPPAPVMTARIPPPDPPEITPDVRRAIDRGLHYLASTQARDGSWRARQGAYPTAITSLAGLALLASGSTPTEGPYARQVSAALTYVLDSARSDGLIARLEEESHNMHGHGFALLFLAECYGMAEDPARQARIRDVLQRGVELTARSQSAAGGWLYTPDARGDEGSVTVTQVQGLRACRNAGIAVPKRTIDRAMDYLVRSSNPDGGVRYQASDSGPGRPPLSAAAVVCWYNAGLYDDPHAVRAREFVERTLAPTSGEAGGHYFYAHLYAAQVHWLSGPDAWARYAESMNRQLLLRQSIDGSWDGDYVGPVYGTSVALLILQLPYRHLPIMQR